MPETRTSPARLPEPFTIDGDVACRTWDDFLVVAAQRWKALRQELMSGRLEAYLKQIGRDDLRPRSAGYASADEQLDRWLGLVPSSTSSAPELDVHPDRLEVRDRGGITRHVVRIGNVGYRMLRGTVRIEPSGTRWLRIDPSFRGPAFSTVEGTDLTLELDLSEGNPAPATAELVIESNGGNRRVAVAVVPADRPPPLPMSTEPPLAGVSLPARVATAVGVAVAVRLLAFVVGTQLATLAVVAAGVGSVLGIWKGWRHAASGAVAGALLGVMAAAPVHAALRTVEGAVGGSVWIGLPAWAAIGAGLAVASELVWPSRRASS